MERVNYTRVVFNWFNSQHCVKWYPKVVYKPILCGLRNRPFSRRGFLSRVSFERPFIALTKAVLQNRKDFLLNFKRNLIVRDQGFVIGTDCIYNIRIINSILDSIKIFKVIKGINILWGVNVKIYLKNI